jgi:hypothetical protein
MALLHETYTGQIVRLYDGSIMEWSHYRHLPMNSPLVHTQWKVAAP